MVAAAAPRAAPSSQMATKTMNEAVVEGMGSVWDASADVKRHIPTPVPPLFAVVGL